MAEGRVGHPEFPNMVTLLADRFEGRTLGEFLHQWEDVIFSAMIVALLSITVYLVSRRSRRIPGRWQSAVELLVGGFDDFVCGILGPQGKKYTPFIGTLFIYILFMNMAGLIPFLKSPTANLSTTVTLALCVFVYVQYTAFKEFGFLGYLDHLAGKPRGGLALSIVFPVMLFAMHLVSELFKPVTLALRLRSNILGEDILLAVLAGLGIPFLGWMLMFFSMLLAIVAAVVQAFVFSVLTSVYFALVLIQEE